VRISTLALVLAVVPAVGVADQCRQGTVVYAREQLAEHHFRVYCVCERDMAAMREIDQQLAQLESRLESDRGALAAWQNDLPKYQEALDEWVRMDEEARQETRAAARDLVIVSSLGSLRMAAASRTNVSRSEMDAMWQTYMNSELGSPEFQNALREHAAGLAAMRKWQSYGDVVHAVESAYQTIQAGNAGANAQYARALAAFMPVALHDPRLTILVSEVDFTASALLGNMTARAARGRIEELSNLGDTRLRALESLSRIYREHVDQKRDLNTRRAAILALAANPDASCPT
jgi:hypothetical protein